MSKLQVNQNINDATYWVSIERAILSSILFDYDLMESINDKLIPAMFYHPAHKVIFETMQNLYREGMPIDESFLRTRIDTKAVDDSILIEIMTVNAITNVEAYIQDMIEIHTKREIISIATLIKKSSLEEFKSSSEIIDLINQKLTEVENFDVVANDIKTLGQWDKEYENEPELGVLPTGIQWIDSTLDDGIKVGNFVFLSGKKETGKTYLATTIMENMASCETKEFPDGIKCGFFSMEFGTKHYRDSVRKKYPHRDNKKREAIFKNIYVEHRVNDIIDIEKKVKKMVKKGVKFVFIDSQLRVTNVAKDQATKAEKLGDAFSRIGMMAQKYEIVIMMVVQTSKADHDAEEISVKGCIDADHEASLWLHIKKQGKTELRDMVFAKNKQNYKRGDVTVKFYPITHEFKKVQTESGGIPVSYENIPRSQTPEESSFEGDDDADMPILL